MTQEDGILAEGRRQCICAIAEQLQWWADLKPSSRDKFIIASITSALGWSADMYVDLGFDHEEPINGAAQ